MNDPLVDYIDKAGQVLAYADDGRVDIVCPWESGHTPGSSESSTSSTSPTSH